MRYTGHHKRSKKKGCLTTSKNMRRHAKIEKFIKKRNRERDRRKERMDGDDRGVSSCGRKIRFPSEKEIVTYINEHYSGKKLYCYKCSYCGGWHLTSHPRGKKAQDVVLDNTVVNQLPQHMVSSPMQSSTHRGESDLTVREVLVAAREAALEIRKIEEQAEIRREMIGPQGHGYESHSKTGIRDPMRHVDDLIVWEQSQINTAELQDPIIEASEIVDGIDKIADPNATEVVSRYYLEAESWYEIARTMEKRTQYLSGLKRDEQVKCLVKIVEMAMKEWESIGIARLKELAHE